MSQRLRREVDVFSPLVPSPFVSFPTSQSISPFLFPKLIRSFPRLWAGSCSCIPQRQRNAGGYSDGRLKTNTIHTPGRIQRSDLWYQRIWCYYFHHTQERGLGRMHPSAFSSLETSASSKRDGARWAEHFASSISGSLRTFRMFQSESH